MDHRNADAIPMRIEDLSIGNDTITIRWGGTRAVNGFYAGLLERQQDNVRFLLVNTVTNTSDGRQSHTVAVPMHEITNITRARSAQVVEFK
jgi:hypothetical protein